MRLSQTIHGFTLFLLILLHSAVFAEEPPATPAFEGIWKWTFTMPDGGQITPRLELKQEDGHLTGATRFRGGSETSITNLTVKNNEVSFQVVRERDGQVAVTRYTGTLDGDTIKGKIVSNWSGEEQSYDWEARRLVGPGGTWKWTTTFGGSKSESKLVLKQEGEKLTGKLTSPRGGDADIKKGKFMDGRISLEVERERDGEKFVSRYHGKLAGDKIQGKMELNFFGRPRTNDWEAFRVD